MYPQPQHVGDIQPLPPCSQGPSNRFRKPQRITITVPWGLHQQLMSCSDQQGRSLSNLACYWLELQAEALRQLD